MVSKVQDYHRLPDLGGKTSSALKSKGKDKARKQLWDSLLEVYEKEANKEYETDIEAVEVDELEKWSSSHTGVSLRALPQLVQSKPQLVSTALAGSLGDTGREQPEDKEEKRGKKIKNKNAMYQNSTHVSSILVRSKKNIHMVKTPGKLNSSIAAERSTANLNRTKKRKLKDINRKKPPEHSLDVILAKSSPKASEQNNRKHKDITNKKCVESSFPVTVAKESTKLNEQPLLSVKKKNAVHNCNLKLRYYSESNNLPTRLDGRVFSCKLIFKVCECLESGEII